MNLVLALTILFFVAFVNSQVCPRNEVAVNCVNQCNTCEVQGNCCDICIPGCDCRRGFYRNSSGQCVNRSACIYTDNQYDRREEENIEKEDSRTDGAALFLFPIFCKKNEVRSLCACPVDCTNYNNKTCSFCIPGCECKKGYAYGPDGTCIPIKECHKEQKPDDCTDLEYYDTCGTYCEKDCKNYNSPDRDCDQSCKIGCFCQPGLVRGPKGDCIWPFQCNISNSKENSLDRLNEHIEPELFNKDEGNELVSDVSDDEHGCPGDPYECHQYCTDNGYLDGVCSDSTCFCQQRGHECDDDTDCIRICDNRHGYCDQEHHCVC